MVAGCGTKIIKFIFFTFNLLFCLVGAVVVGLSVWLRLDNQFGNTVQKVARSSGITDININFENMYIALYIIIGIGGIMFIMGFLGCCGAFCESVCLLGLYFSIVLVCFCIKIAGAIYIYVRKDAFRDEAADWYKKELVDRAITAPPNSDLIKQLDYLHRNYTCCGARGCSDYPTPPPSCNCNVTVKPPGCANKFFDEVKDNWWIAAIVGGVVLLIELVAMIFACCLCSAIRSGGYDYYY